MVRTLFTKWQAASAILLPVQLGQKPRFLHEKAVIFSSLQSSHLRRRKPVCLHTFSPLTSGTSQLRGRELNLGLLHDGQEY